MNTSTRIWGRVSKRSSHVNGLHMLASPSAVFSLKSGDHTIVLNKAQGSSSENDMPEECLLWQEGDTTKELLPALELISNFPLF